jgi:putative transposase
LCRLTCKHDQRMTVTYAACGTFGCSGALHHVMIRGLEQGRRPELTGGGLRRSRAGWRSLEGIRRGREQWAFDERVLGSSEFVARIVEQCAASTPMSGMSCVEAEQQINRLVRQTAVATELTVAELSGGGKQRHIVPVRLRIAAAARREHGLPVAVVAQALGISPRTVLRAAQSSFAPGATQGASQPTPRYEAKKGKR